MQTLSLPTGAAFFALRVELEGSLFTLDFAWNARAEMWFVSVLNDEGTALVRGLGVASNVRLLERFKFLGGLPAGELVAADLTSTIEAPNYEQLGTVVELVYYTAAEIAEIDAA